MKVISFLPVKKYFGERIKGQLTLKLHTKKTKKTGNMEMWEHPALCAPM